MEVLMLLFWFAPALALDCAFGPLSVNNGAPSPTNAVWVVPFAGEPGADPVQVLDADDAPLAVDIEVRADHLRVTPQEPLEPGAELLMILGYRQFDVQVGDGPDDEAPDAPVFVSVDRQTERDRDWGTTRLTVVEFEPLPAGVHLEIELSEDESFADALTTLTLSPSVSLGENLCSTNPEGYDHDAAYFLRARAVDQAGNTSDWTLEEPAPKGCSTAGSAALGLWALPMLALGWRRR